MKKLQQDVIIVEFAEPKKDLSSFEINQVVVEILSAARESAKTGKEVKLQH